MIRIVFTPVYDERRHTKFVTEINPDLLMDIKEIHSLGVVSNTSGEILHKVELDLPEKWTFNSKIF